MNKDAHNLEPYDLLNAVDVINKADDITLADWRHADCPVIIFNYDIGGGILTILTEAHERWGYLLVWDAWRKTKALSRTTAKMPSAHVLNDSQLALS
jgi:hypothetical protein